MIFYETQKKSGVFNGIFILFDSNVNHSSISNTLRVSVKKKGAEKV